MAGLFPPQARDWSLPTGVPLSPHAYRRVTREAITQSSFDKAATAINEDWGTQYERKHLQRFSERAGETLLAQQAQQREVYERGQRPAGPDQPLPLLVIGMDGGRVQTREKDETAGGDGSRWREDKVLTISSYEPGDPTQQQQPQALSTTCLATMHDSKAFGHHARLEAERRGIRQAAQTVVIGDGAAWIDTIHQKHFHRHPRIVDWYHASEHLHEVAKAAYSEDDNEQRALAEGLTQALWDGQVRSVIQTLQTLAERAGPPQANDPPNHPRRLLQQNVGYFERHAEAMNYPAFRERGWPIGSGMTEGGVKQFNKRVKGTEQFWSEQGVEPILALRSLWLSDDTRWHHYWLGHAPEQKAA